MISSNGGLCFAEPQFLERNSPHRIVGKQANARSLQAERPGVRQTNWRMVFKPPESSNARNAASVARTNAPAVVISLLRDSQLHPTFGCLSKCIARLNSTFGLADHFSWAKGSSHRDSVNYTDLRVKYGVSHPADPRLPQAGMRDGLHARNCHFTPLRQFERSKPPLLPSGAHDPGERAPRDGDGEQQTPV